MRLIEMLFVIAATLWLVMPLAYLLLIQLTLGVKLTVRNKTSRGGNEHQGSSQLRASSD